MSIELASLLVVHFLCNAHASIAPVSLTDAAYCSANFETLKIALNPTLTAEEYAQMSEREKANVSVESYNYYRKWLVENPGLADTLRQFSNAFLVNSKNHT